MGYLLREALKTLCGVNRWSYVVFWKMGCQNPRLLIWEECYYEPSTCSVPVHRHGSRDSSFGAVPPECLASQPGTQAEDKLQSLIDRMMNNNQICVIGEGIVGRAAFTGNHQWFLSNSNSGDFHPREVANEMHHQFSAGIQTVAVIPVSPHGVVQLGSSYPIMENLGFVNDMKSLILQLGCIPGALFTVGCRENVGVPDHLGRGHNNTPDDCKMTSSNDLKIGSCEELSSSSNCSRVNYGQSSSLLKHVLENLSVTDSSLGSPYHLPEKAGFCSRSQVERGTVRADVIRLNSNEQPSQFIASDNAFSGGTLQAPQGHMGVWRCTKPMKKQIPMVLGAHNLNNSETSDLNSIITSKLRKHSSSVLDPSKTSGTAQFLQEDDLPNELTNHSRPVIQPSSFSVALEQSVSSQTQLEGIPLFSLSEQLMAHATEVNSGSSDLVNYLMGINHPRLGTAWKNQRMGSDSTLAPSMPSTYIEDNKPYLENELCNPVFSDLKHEDSFQRTEGDNLFDILGVEMKKKIFNGRFDAANSQILSSSGLTSGSAQEVEQNLYSIDEGLPGGGAFSMTGNDHLLDAVVSGAQSALKQNLDDSRPCRTTLTRINSSSVSSSSLGYCQSNTCSKVQEEPFATLRPPAEEGNLVSSSQTSGCTKNMEAACSQSFCHKRENSILTALSKGPDEATGNSRKRLKPGKNPKPRPKDRQLIQDRLKELRDIVPNGGKCSIDSLLERTVRHMMFLQGVTKHTERHMGESRIVEEEGRVFLKDNFNGGATWAFDIGSQTGVYPIIVEDLDPPRQLLVEMLCEDRGFFLEIADMIRRLGLTILTGAMESRNQKIWARFAVEANRDVTRMEVFMSLVQALEQLMKGVSMPDTAVGDHMMPNNSLGCSTSIPVTGVPSSVQ